MRTITVTASISLDFEIDGADDYIQTEEDARGEMVEYLMSGDAGPDEFDYTVKTTED